MKASSQYTHTPLNELQIISEQKWPEGTLPFVSTATLTYNHGSYIRECLLGILMQKTTFPVQICIFEDCSTDNTVSIIKEFEDKYPHLFISFLQPENTWGKSTRNDAKKPYMEAVYKAKYVALCEGDDYWTDPLKLQKQVNFLEKNLNYGGVSTNNRWFFEKEKTFKDSIFEEGAITFEQLCESNKVNSQTVLYKKDVLPNMGWMSDLKIGDWALHLALTSKLPYFRIKDITTLYRVHTGGVHSLLAEEQKIRNRIDVLIAVLENLKLSNTRKELLRFSIQNLLKRLIAYDPEDLKAIRKQYFSYGGSVLNKTLFKSYFK